MKVKISRKIKIGGFFIDIEPEMHNKVNFGLFYPVSELNKLTKVATFYKVKIGILND